MGSMFPPKMGKHLHSIILVRSRLLGKLRRHRMMMWIRLYYQPSQRFNQSNGDNLILTQEEDCFINLQILLKKMLNF